MPRDFDKWDGCTTKNFVGLGLAFTPTWFQVFPGVDLQAPLTYAIGLKGNSATVFGGNQGLGNYTLGLGADVYQKYRFDLKYIDYLGRYRDNGTAVTTPERLHRLPEGSRRGEPHVQDHVLNPCSASPFQETSR